MVQRFGDEVTIVFTDRTPDLVIIKEYTSFVVC